MGRAAQGALSRQQRAEFALIQGLSPAAASADADTVVSALLECGMIAAKSEVRRIVSVAGGVSCDVYRVDLPGRSVGVKRALPRLRVAAEWNAPVERSAYEVLWLRRAQAWGVRAPHVLASLPDRNLFVMQWFDAAAHPVWKAELHAGRVDADFARRVGAALALVHNRSSADETVARDFASDELFRQLRISPYLDATAVEHPDLAARIGALAASLARTKVALVHGDVSPKNILCAAEGPLFLDAECAWHGDPAFDAAFCLTHLLLKALKLGTRASRDACGAFAGAWLDDAGWEEAAALSRRTAPLLAALLLARVDGKSPVEYLNASERAFVRRFARDFLHRPAEDGDDIDALKHMWFERLDSR